MNIKKYYWCGINETGTLIEGELNSENSDTVKLELQNKNISPLKIRRKFSVVLKHRKISQKNIADLSRQLFTLINSSIPLLPALSIIEKSHANPNMRKLIATIMNDIINGTSLTESLKKHPRYFDALFCNLIYAGEQSGSLEEILNNIVIYKENTEKIKSKIKKALIYPVLVLATAIIITIILLVFVVPQFAELFHGFGAELPAYTQLVINLSVITKNNITFMLLICFVFGIAFKLLKKYSANFRIFIDSFLLKLPFFGKTLKKAIIARFAQTLTITLKAGLPLSDALLLTAKTVNNIIYSRAVLSIREQVVSGQSITKAITDSLLFPFRTKQMITIGEESGSLIIMLENITKYYAAEVNYIVDNLNTLLEPAIIIILGILIGGLIIGMYLPIFKLGSII